VGGDGSGAAELAETRPRGAPRGERVPVDAAGHVFVADRRADRVQEFTAHGHPLAAWGAPGPGLGELSGPTAVATDCRGDVLVADTRNNRVQVFAGAAARGACASSARTQLGA
ncbi:MAG: hypothetical protein ACHQE6_11255, partial [Solirubrobacterales bacterium]